MKQTRIAMWSGPRNISTALMRSWENRADTMVIDEPLYGPYLFQTGKKHPMSAEIISNQGKHYEPIIKELVSCKFPKDISIYYQKHMAHHILPDTDLAWIHKMDNAILLRHPDEVLSSYLEKYPKATPEDLGFPQLLRILKLIMKQHGTPPPVFESKNILINPERMLGLMCTHFNVPFDKDMLNWPKGYRDSDGVWAPHWYNNVIQSTGFGKYTPKNISLTPDEKKVAEKCMPYYLELLKFSVN